MEVFSAVLTVLASNIVKSVVSGKKPDRDEWGDVASSILNVLVSGQARTDMTLTTIRSDIKALRIADYENSMRAGIRHLEDARAVWRTSSTREASLQQARGKFIEGAASAPDELSLASSEWHIAITWLLSESVPDCLVALRRSADAALTALVDICDILRVPPSRYVSSRSEELTSPGQKILDYIRGSTSPTQQNSPEQIRSRLRQELTPKLSEVLNAFNAVQLTRRQLGAPPNEVATAYVTGLPPIIGEWRVNHPKLVLDMPTSGMDILGCRLALKQGSNITPASNGSSEVDIWASVRLAGANQAAAIRLSSGGELIPDFFYESTSRQYPDVKGRPLPGPPLFQGRKDYERLREIVPGRLHEGWTRLDCSGRPTAVTVKLYRRNPAGGDSFGLYAYMKISDYFPDTQSLSADGRHGLGPEWPHHRDRRRW